MKRWQKILLVLLIVVLVTQIPFAYRRYQLGKLYATIQQVNSQRSVLHHDAFKEHKGVVHVHSFLGGHSKGNFEEIIAAAQANQLDFVVMTEHTSSDFNTAAMTLKGFHAGVLFINGNEVSTANGDRVLIMPGDESANSIGELSTNDIIATAGGRGARAFVAYPAEFKSWEASGYEGVEVYNVYTNAQRVNPVVMFFDGLWSYRSYPDLLFANFYRRPVENLDRWDTAMGITGRRLTAIAGNDAHANVGISLNNSSGKKLLGLQLDPYERSFRLVRVHVLAPSQQAFNQDALLEALGKGHCFIGFDLFGDTSGFSFSASNGVDTVIQGDEIPFAANVRLMVNVPVLSRIILFKDGKAIQDETGVKDKEFAVSGKGSYRVEVYLPQLGKPVADQPWIISNPIYVR